MSDDQIVNLALKLAQRRAAVELDAVAAVLSNPAKTMPIAEAAGVVQHCFKQPDLRLIFLAADVARDRDRAVIFRLARAALQAKCLWDSTQIRGNWRVGMRWSDETLAALACSFPFIRSSVERACIELVTIDRDCRDIRSQYRHLIESMERATSPLPEQLRPARREPSAPAMVVAREPLAGAA